MGNVVHIMRNACKLLLHSSSDLHSNKCALHFESKNLANQPGSLHENVCFTHNAKYSTKVLELNVNYHNADDNSGNL